MSSFAGRGKKRAFAMVRDSQVMNESVQVLGESLPLSELSIIKLEEVVCRLYNDNQCKLVNDLRYKMFCKGKNVQSHQLPPTSAALHYHLKRANYQAFLKLFFSGFSLEESLTAKNRPRTGKPWMATEGKTP